MRSGSCQGTWKTLEKYCVFSPVQLTTALKWRNSPKCKPNQTVILYDLKHLLGLSHFNRNGNYIYFHVKVQDIVNTTHQFHLIDCFVCHKAKYVNMCRDHFLPHFVARRCIEATTDTTWWKRVTPQILRKTIKPKMDVQVYIGHAPSQQPVAPTYETVFSTTRGWEFPASYAELGVFLNYWSHTIYPSCVLYPWSWWHTWGNFLLQVVLASSALEKQSLEHGHSNQVRHCCCYRAAHTCWAHTTATTTAALIDNNWPSILKPTINSRCSPLFDMP